MLIKLIKSKFKQSNKWHSKKIPFILWQLCLKISCLLARLQLISKFRIEMGEDFAHLELRGICLSDFDLTNANFEGTDLSDANLRGANLENAKLVSTKLDGADLSNTKLTGICIQNWQVTETTKFEGVDCKYIYLIPENQKNDFRRELKLEELENIDKFFKELLISSEAKKKIKELIEQFDIIDLIGDKVIREYRLTQAVKSAEDSYGIEEDRFHQMFEDYRKQKLQAKRQSSWWQNFLWFKVEPSIEKLNILTKEMDIFPLLEQIGRLSILIAVIAYINDALQPPKLNLEEQYRSWEILQSDNEKVRGISRFALEQLRDKGNTLKKIQVRTGVDLSGINLSNADLTSASLNGVKLQGANLSKAKLQDADLRNADLKEASLGYLSSSDQNKSKGFENILQNVLPILPLPSVLNLGADLRNAKLQKANLIDADLQGVDLRQADLQGADLTGANLTKANLNGAKNLGTVVYGNANLTKADLQGVDLTEADLQGANLQGADLTNANLTEANLTGANLTGATLTETDLQRADLTNANLTGAKLNGAKNLVTVTSWNLTNLSGANLSSFKGKKQFTGAFYLNDFIKRPQKPLLPKGLTTEKLGIKHIENINKLHGVNLTGADLKMTNLSKADLTSANLSYSNLSYSNLSYSNLSYSNLSEADLSYSNLSYSNLSEADLSEADLSEADLTGAKYSKATKFTKGFKPQDKGMVEIK